MSEVLEARTSPKFIKAALTGQTVLSVNAPDLSQLELLLGALDLRGLIH
jgi:hypothetical protein